MAWRVLPFALLGCTGLIVILLRRRRRPAFLFAISGDTMRRIDLEVAAKIKTIRTNEVVALRITDFVAYTLRPPRACLIVVVAGHGNNGHNGISAARMLVARAHRVACVLSDESKLTEWPREQLDLFRAFGGVVEANLDFVQRERAPVLLIDALLGHGIASSPRGRVAELIRAINAMRGAHGRNTQVLSVDLPSGCNHESGTCHEPCVIADYTLTLHVPKSGLVVSEARAHVGKLTVCETNLTFTEWGDETNRALCALFASGPYVRLS